MISKNLFLKNSNFLFYFILFIILNIFLSSLYNSSFVGDDAYSSQIKGLLLINDQTLYEKIYIEFIAWAKGAGRLTPVMWTYVYSLFYFIQNIFIIKFLVIVVVYLNLIFFFKILYYLSNNKLFSYSATIFVIPFLHFKAWHDAILSFVFLTPLMLLFLLSSIYLFFKANKKLYFIFFIVIITSAVLTYELSYFFPIFYLFFFFYFIKKPSQKKLVYISIITVVSHFILSKLIFYIFSESVSTYPGNEIVLNLKVNIHAFFYQVISSIPGIWFFAKNAPKINLVDFNVIILLFFLILSFFLCIYFLRLNNKPSIKNLNTITIFSILLICVPAIIPSISKGHSAQIINLGIGYGYTPVYFQFFGLALFFFNFLYFILFFLKAKNFKIIIYIFFIFFSLSAYFIFSYNNFIVKNSNKSFKFPRTIIDEAISNGLFADIKDGNLIIRNYRYPSDNSWFYSTVANKKIRACALNAKNEFPLCLDNYKIIGSYSYDKILKENILANKSTPDKIYGLSYYVTDNDSGYVVLGEIENFNLTENIYHNMRFKNYKYFDQRSKIVEQKYSNRYLDFMKVMERETFSDKFVEGNYLINNFEFIFKNFLSVEGSKTDYFRWSSNESEMIIINNQNTDELKKLSFTLIRPNYENISINFYSDNINKKFNFSNRINISLEINLKPGLNRFKFSTDAKKVNEDPRNLVFAIYNYKIN